MNEKSLPDQNTAAVSPPKTASVTMPAWSGRSRVADAVLGVGGDGQDRQKSSVYSST